MVASDVSDGLSLMLLLSAASVMVDDLLLATRCCALAGRLISLKRCCNWILCAIMNLLVSTCFASCLWHSSIFPLQSYRRRHSARSCTVVSKIFQGIWGAVAPETKFPRPRLEKFSAKPCICMPSPCCSSMHVKITKSAQAQNIKVEQIKIKQL